MKLGFGPVLAASVVVLGALFFALRAGQESPWRNYDAGGPLVLYCAAGIRPPVSEIIAAYEQEYGATVQTKYAGSGTLLSDIRAGGGDLFLAADQAYLHDARDRKLVREVLPIAIQYPVLAVRNGNPKDIRGLDDLKRDDVKLSLADPKAAAISRIARELMEHRHAGDWDAAWKKAEVHRSTVNEVANDVDKLNSGDVGIVWDATAVQYPGLEMIRVPEFDASKNFIAIGVLESSEQPTRALHFARYISARSKGLEIFRKHGYAVVEGDDWADSPELLVFSGGLNRLTVEPVVKEFEQREGVSIVTVFNGCGTLVGQMRTGARPDLYFACDTSFMANVKEMFRDAANVSRTNMVIITPKGNPKGIKTLEDMAKPGLKIALCDPKKSALGALSDDLLARHNILKPVRDNVQASAATADQLVQHIVVGDLDAAIVYTANTVHQAAKLNVIPIDDPTANAVQPVAVGRESKYPHLAERLMQKLRSTQNQRLFLDNGFDWLGAGGEAGDGSSLRN